VQVARNSRDITGMGDSSAGEPRRGGWVHLVRDVAVIVLVALLVSMLLKAFLVRSFYIPSGSMESTLQVNDRILVNELSPRFFPLNRGDVVVFTDPGGWLSTPLRAPDPVEWVLSLVGLTAPDSEHHLIKRVIGLPGDHVTCCTSTGQLTLNNIPVTEPYLKDPDAPASSVPFDVVVPAGSLWVMGDNRANSLDSRFHTDDPSLGFVPVSNVVGTAFLLTWPLDRFGWISTYP
jgi:signal peptidase I